MEIKNINIKIKSTTDTSELEQSAQTLIGKAQEAAKRAYAPYSNFQVGACLLLDNGEMIEGNNQENASYPCGSCAERTALHYANSRFPNSIVKAIAISAYNQNGLLDEPITPCGMCRQALLEAEVRSQKNMQVILNGKNRTYILDKATDLLPLSFDNSKL